jgi:hypothetical protein
MEKYMIDHDISLMYVQAVSFPLGVGGAFKKLEEKLGNNQARPRYGISFSDGKGGITYRAAVEEAFDGEAAQTGCEAFMVHKGTFASIYINDWKKDESSVGRAFNELLQHPQLDPKGYCLEMYPKGNDVRCLVPLTA